MRIAKLVAAASLAVLSWATLAQETVTRRLPYEPLPEGRTELHYGISYTEQSRDEGGVKLTFENSTSSISLYRGITDRLEIGAILPYVHSARREIELVPGFSVTEKRHGHGDPVFHASYALMKEQERNTGVTAGLRFSPNTSGGSNAFAAEHDTLEPFIALGKSLTRDLQGFARYGYTRTRGASADSHVVTVGGRQALGERSGVGASLGLRRIGSSRTEESFNSYGFSLWGYLRLGQQFFLVPSWSETRTGAHQRTDINVRVSEGTTHQVSLSLAAQF
jgi:hypothetical protein